MTELRGERRREQLGTPATIAELEQQRSRRHAVDVEETPPEIVETDREDGGVGWSGSRAPGRGEVRPRV